MASLLARLAKRKDLSVTTTSPCGTCPAIYFFARAKTLFVSPNQNTSRSIWSTCSSGGRSRCAARRGAACRYARAACTSGCTTAFGPVHRTPPYASPVPCVHPERTTAVRVGKPEFYLRACARRDAAIYRPDSRCYEPSPMRVSSRAKARSVS
jgi:hypothetical protein